MNFDFFGGRSSSDHPHPHDHGDGGHHHGHDHSHEPGLRAPWRSGRAASFLREHFRLIALLLYFASGLYLVAPEQQAVVTRFGRVVANGVGPGLHYHWPWPVEGIVKLKALETKRLTLGVEMPDQVLGRGGGARVQFLTGDQNIIAVVVAVQYGIKDAGAYLFRAEDATRLIETAVASAFAHTIAVEPVDNLLTTGKAAAQNATLARARALLDGYGSGVHLSAVSIENVAPPEEVADAFREVASARADRDRIINEAHGYASDALAKAAGEAGKLVSDAGGYREQRINEAQGEAARFDKLLTASGQARDLTGQRLYLEAMEEILPRMKKVVIDSAGGRGLVDLGIFQPGLSPRPTPSSPK
ncbi:MAG: FtsH protease activity modulator HflK [Blastocatellia bacterium]|nr:FtsH protease activity modulator HflK [Blastocatellia bacterium]